MKDFNINIDTASSHCHTRQSDPKLQTKLRKCENGMKQLILIRNPASGFLDKTACFHEHFYKNFLWFF